MSGSFLYSQQMNADQIYWHKIKVTLPPKFEEEASARLVALGSNGVWVEEEKDAVHLNVFFPGNLPQKKVVQSIRKTFSSLIPEEKISIASERLAEEQWQTTWQKHSIPKQRIGKRILIIPPWKKMGPNPSKRKVICLSPGMAFGTGTHATTRSCLIFLEEILSKTRRGPLLDVGTGSGILAIAAVKLGVHRVTAVEIDPVSLEMAKENTRVNKVLSKISFRETIPTRTHYPIITANLTASILCDLGQTLTKAVSPRGKLILSGMMKEEYPEILARYQKTFFLIKSRTKDNWVTLLMKKK